MVGNQQPKFRCSDIAPDAVSDCDQKGQLDDRPVLNRWIMRDVASRTTRVRTPCVIVSKG